MKKAAGLLAAMTMVLAACGTGAAEESAAGLGDSVHIEGHWSIEVRNPDGSLDQRVEFQNAIVSLGWETIGRLMTGEWGMEQAWAVGINGSFCDAPNNYCALPATATFDDVATAVVVEGSITAPQDGDIGTVRSVNKVCRFDAGRDCVADNFSSFFSAHNISPAITVAGGQIVQVEIQFTLG
jgi:hypothetical protein